MQKRQRQVRNLKQNVLECFSTVTLEFPEDEARKLLSIGFYIDTTMNYNKHEYTFSNIIYIQNRESNVMSEEKDAFNLEVY